MQFKIGDKLKCITSWQDFMKNKIYTIHAAPNGWSTGLPIINPQNDKNKHGNIVNHAAFPKNCFILYNEPSKNEIDYYRWLADRNK